MFHWGVKGAAMATVISQYVSGVGIMLYYRVRFPHLQIQTHHMKWDGQILKEIAGAIFSDVYSAINYESGHFNGAGIGK